MYNILIFEQIQNPGIFMSNLLDAALCSSWEHGLYGVPQAFATHRQILKCRASQVEKCGTKGVKENLKRDFDDIEDGGEGVGREGLEDLEDETEKVVVLKESLSIQEPASHVAQIDARETIYSSGVASNAARLC